MNITITFKTDDDSYFYECARGQEERESFIINEVRNDEVIIITTKKNADAIAFFHSLTHIDVMNHFNVKSVSLS